MRDDEAYTTATLQARLSLLCENMPKKVSKKNVNNVNIQILDDKKLTFIIC